MSSSSKAPPGQPEGEEEDAVDAMGRKVWDKDQYMERAKNNIMFGPEKIGRRKDAVIPLPSSQRTFLKQRTHDLNLEQNLGKMQVVTKHTIKPMQGGYWCSVCECLLKDSATWLDHINGRRHNRNLGMNMKVEKIGVDRVREKLKSMRKEPAAEVEQEDIETRIAALEAEQEDKKRRKKERRKNKNRGCKDPAGAGEESDDGADEEPDAKKSRGAPGGEADEDDDEGEAEQETEEMKMLKAMGLPTGFA